jgi:phosphate transport system substrate-binding protein
VASKGAAVKGFLTWMLDKGESEASSMGYAPLPKQVVDMERKTIMKVQ